MIMPPIVAPDTEGFELALTVKPELTVAPFEGELTVITSLAGWVDGAVYTRFGRAADALRRPRMLKKKHSQTMWAENVEHGRTEYLRCFNSAPWVVGSDLTINSISGGATLPPAPGKSSVGRSYEKLLRSSANRVSGQWCVSMWKPTRGGGTEPLHAKSPN